MGNLPSGPFLTGRGFVGFLLLGGTLFWLATTVISQLPNVLPSFEAPQENPQGDIERVNELADNFVLLRTSFTHLSAASRLCANNKNSKACELFEKAYNTYYTVGYQAPASVPTNIRVRQLGRDKRMNVKLVLFLQSNKERFGRIHSTDRIFDIGATYFKAMVKQYRINADDFIQIKWILLLQGYSLEQWEKNDPASVEGLRPQMEKLAEDASIDELPAISSVRDDLRYAGFKTIGDLINFISDHPDTWEAEIIKSTGIRKPRVADIKDALVDAGHEGVFENAAQAATLDRNIPIEELGLTPAVRESLKRRGISTVGALLSKIQEYSNSKKGNWKEEMARENIPQVGPASIDKIEKALNEKGYEGLLKRLEKK